MPSLIVISLARCRCRSTARAVSAVLLTFSRPSLRAGGTSVAQSGSISMETCGSRSGVGRLTLGRGVPWAEQYDESRQQGDFALLYNADTHAYLMGVRINKDVLNSPGKN